MTDAKTLCSNSQVSLLERKDLRITANYLDLDGKRDNKEFSRTLYSLAKYLLQRDESLIYENELIKLVKFNLENSQTTRENTSTDSSGLSTSSMNNKIPKRDTCEAITSGKTQVEGGLDREDWPHIDFSYKPSKKEIQKIHKSILNRITKSILAELDNPEGSE